MKTLRPRTGTSLAAAALAAVFAGGAAHSMVAAGGDAPHRPLSATEAELLFADTPDGVDPVVTGPVSASFRRTQRDAGCATARWPDIPLSCYPK